MKIIAHIHTDFPEKFGIPRQSGLVDALQAKIVFTPEYRNPSAFIGLEGFTHIWLIWQFSKSVREEWSPMVRPPRLGGDKKMGVFATRSPFRPNAIGLSSVKLDRIEEDSELGTVLYVSGADLLDGTPIYDIKPYLPFTDSHPEAVGGFADSFKEYGLEVNFPEELLAQIPKEKREAVLGILKQDPRPSYQDNPDRIYGVAFGNKNIRFQVKDSVLTVIEIDEFHGSSKK